MPRLAVEDAFLAGTAGVLSRRCGLCRQNPDWSVLSKVNLPSGDRRPALRERTACAFGEHFEFGSDEDSSYHGRHM